MERIGACTPDNFSKKNDMSIDNEISDNNLIADIHEWQGNGRIGEQRKTPRDIAAERREKNVEKFKSYQDRAYKKLKERKVNLFFVLFFY